MNPRQDDDDIIDVQPLGEPTAAHPADAGTLRTWGWASYILHLIVALAALVPGGQWGPLLLIVALAIDVFHRSSAQGTWQASHVQWRLWSVGVAGLMYVVTAPLWLLFVLPGWAAWILVSLWFLYRIVRGMVAMHAEKPVGV